MSTPFVGSVRELYVRVFPSISLPDKLSESIESSFRVYDAFDTTGALFGRLSEIVTVPVLERAPL